MMLCALAPACSSETVEMPPAAPVYWRPADLATASPTTPTVKERAVADAYTKALASPGFGELGSLVDQDARLVFGARDTRGRGRVVKAHDDMFGAFDERHFVTSHIWLTDSTGLPNSQAFEWTMTGVQTRDWLGVSSTRKPVVIKGLTLLWTNDDGIISEIHLYLDEEVIKAQLGKGPADLQKLPAPTPPAGPPQISERNGTEEETASVALMRATLRALQNDNEASFLSTMADDVEVFTLDRAEPARGSDSARAYFRTTRKSIRQLDTAIQNVWGIGSFVIVEYSINGLQIAPLRRIPFRAESALHTLHTQFVDVAAIRDGKITRIWRYADPITFVSQ